MSHGQIRTHKTHHSPNLGEATTFPLIIYFVPGHGTSTQMSFCLPNVILSWDSQVKVPKFPQLGFSQFWGRITLRANLRLRWVLKQSCSLIKSFPSVFARHLLERKSRWFSTFSGQESNWLPWECEGSFFHTLLHSHEYEMWLLGFILGSHPYKPLP
jgi:hypothetical protein